MSLNQSTAIKILQLTDFHLRAETGGTLMGVDTEQSLIEVLDTALAEGIVPDLALLTGDLVQDPEPASYQRLAQILARLPCPAYCLPGNHDEPALMGNWLAGNQIYSQTCIVMDDWQIICLDSSIPGSPKGNLADAQLDLLETCLKNHPKHNTLVALHHHPLPTGSVWMDTMQLQNADAFLAILTAYPSVRGVIFGHIHQSMETGYQGIRMLGTPSTCFQFMPGRDNFALDPVPSGYRWLELERNGEINTWVGRTKSPPKGLTVASNGY